MPEPQAALATPRPDPPGTRQPPERSLRRPGRPDGADQMRRWRPGRKQHGGPSGGPRVGNRPPQLRARQGDRPDLGPTGPRLQSADRPPPGPTADPEAAQRHPRRPPRQRHRHRPRPRNPASTNVPPSSESDPTGRSEWPTAPPPAPGARTSPAPARRSCRQTGETCGPSSAARKGIHGKAEGYRPPRGETIRNRR